MDRRTGPSLLVLIALSLSLWLVADLRRGLWEPDEARYAYVAREMREDGHWFVPHLHGEPYPDKPPLMFWMINASSWITAGTIGRLSTRLPSLLGALLTLWATSRLMERWRDGPAAWRAVGVLMTAYLFWWQGGWGQIDALLCGLEMASLWCFFTATDSGCGWRFLPAYLLVGCAILAKGPVGLAIPLGVYVTVTLAAGERDLLRRRHWVWGLPLALLIPAAWLAIAWAQGAPYDYFAAMFGEKSFGRVVLRDGHAQPFYYYLEMFPAGFLPWTIFLPAAYLGLGPGPTRRRLVGWGLFVLLLFSLFVGKRHLYVLAAYPAAAMLVAAGWDGIRGLAPRRQAATARAAIGLTGLVGLGEILGSLAPRTPIAGWTLLPPAAILLAGVALLALADRRERFGARWLAAFIAIWFVHLVAAGALVLPAANVLKSPDGFAREVQAVVDADEPIYVFREQLAILPLYAERRGRRLQSVDELECLLATGDRAVVVFERDDWTAIPQSLAHRGRAHEFLMGGKALVWTDFTGSVAAAKREARGDLLPPAP